MRTLREQLQYIKDAGFDLTDFETEDLLIGYIKDLNISKEELQMSIIRKQDSERYGIKSNNIEKQKHIVTAGGFYVETGYGCMPTTRHQYLVKSDEQQEELNKYLEDNFIKCF